MVRLSDSIDIQGCPVTLAFSKSGRAFFSERVTGNLWEILGDENYRLIKHFDIVQVTGHHESGLLGIDLDPNFDENGNIFVYYTEGTDIDHANNKVVCFNIKNGKQEVLVSGIPAGRIHNGGIIVCGPDGKLYFGTGIGNDVMEKAQDLKNLGGKLLRINLDGSLPPDNPFKGSPIYTYGHRNIFGMAFSPKNGKLYVCDVGPGSDDEINIIEPGGNYGWPDVVGFTNKPHFIGPIKTYTPTITPTQSCFYKDDLYFGSYNQGSVHKLVLSSDGGNVVSDTIVYQGKPFGTVGIFIGPGEDFFVATTTKLLRIKLKGGTTKMKNKPLIWAMVILAIVALGVGGYFIYNSSVKTNNVTNTTKNTTPGTVTIQNFAFSPTTITINVGDTVTWQNNDSTIHHIIANDGSFDLGDVVSGATSSFKFVTAGTYNYHCSIHTYMTGTVIVQ